MYQVLVGDCLEVLPTLDADSIDAVVTDPPYGLSFMGKAWDKGVPSVDVWREVLRVLKPGGHLLAFAGTRTQHRMASAIEDAGFEIRDMIAWVYGSGFPKSLDVSKAIDKTNGEAGRLHKFTAWMRTTGLKSSEIDRITDTNMGGHYLTAASQPAIPTAALWEKLRPHCGDVPAWVDELVERIEAEREVVGSKKSGIADKTEGPRHTIGASRAVEVDITAPATPEAQQWDGWGTALKPALEPITVARKPLTGTVAANVLEYGTGAINVDGCRVGTEEELGRNNNTNPYGSERTWSVSKTPPQNNVGKAPQGRWPANLIHDGSDEVVGLFPVTKSGALNAGHKRGSGATSYDGGGGVVQRNYGNDSGSAARFFYCAKASKRDRDEGCEGMPEVLTMRYSEKAQGPLPQQTPSKPVPPRNHHPTVKPTDLMRYLIRLVTPPGGVVLDPYTGSGSTGKACMYEGFNFIGIELDADYVEIARARIEYTVNDKPEDDGQPGLFDDLDTAT